MVRVLDDLGPSKGSKLPIVVDTFPCLAQIKGDLTDGALKCAPGAPWLGFWTI